MHDPATKAGPPVKKQDWSLSIYTDTPHFRLVPLPILRMIVERRTRSVLPILLGAAALSGCSASALRPAPAPPPAVPEAAGAPMSQTCSSAVQVASRNGEVAELPLATFDTAWSIIQRTHWDTTYNGVNWLAVRDELRPRAAAAQTRGALRAVLSDMLSRLGQSHFAVIPQELADGTAADNGGRSADIGGGGWLGVTFRLLEHSMVLTAVDSGGPAWHAGLRPGWRLEAIRGCPVPGPASVPGEVDARRKALRAYQMTTRSLDAAPGDTMTVTVRTPEGLRLSPTLTLGNPPGTVAKFGNLPPMLAQLSWRRIHQRDRSIGVIRFNTWMPVLSPQFDAAIDSLRSVDAIVLDVRGNLGGVGGMAMGIAGHFLDSVQLLGTMHQRSATLRMVTNPRRVDTRARPVQPYSGPLAIVVDELSASTTELFAGGLQALGRAMLFGTQTAGQVLPAIPERLPNGDVLYHAIADFIGATGHPLEGDGVHPDHVTPPTVRALVEGRDPALEAALAWATQRAARRPVH